MYISKLLAPEAVMDPYEDDYDEHPEHIALSERLRKTLYFGRPPGSDRPSMPLTEIAVEYFRDAAPKELGRVDMYFASNVGRKAYASPSSVMAGMMYVKRLRNRNPDYLQQITSSDLFLISMLVASKYLYDEGTDEEVYNDEWADAAEMDINDINDLEREFLGAIDWNLFVRDQEFERMLENIEAQIAWNKGMERGHFTYTDLLSLSDKLMCRTKILDALADITKVMMACSMAYFAAGMVLAATPTALTIASTSLPTNMALPAKPRIAIEEHPSSNSQNESHNMESHRVQGINVPDRIEEQLTSENPRFQVLSLVALTMVKETVLYFLHNRIFPSSVSQMLNDDSTHENPGSWSCRCGACADRDSDLCYNISALDNGNGQRCDEGDYECFKSCKCSKGQIIDQRNEWCDLGNTCCCCPYSSSTLIKPLFSDVVLGFQTQQVACG